MQISIIQCLQMDKPVFLIQTVRSWKEMYNFWVNLFQILFIYSKYMRSKELLPLNTLTIYFVLYVAIYLTHSWKKMIKLYS